MAPVLHEILASQKSAFLILDPLFQNELEDQLEREDNQGLSLKIHLT